MNTIAFGLPGPTEMLLILGVLLLIFGGRKLPELARAMGTSITQFKKGLKDDREMLDEKKDPVDRESREDRESKKDKDDSQGGAASGS